LIVRDLQKSIFEGDIVEMESSISPVGTAVFQEVTP